MSSNGWVCGKQAIGQAGAQLSRRRREAHLLIVGQGRNSKDVLNMSHCPAAKCKIAVEIGHLSLLENARAIQRSLASKRHIRDLRTPRSRGNGQLTGECSLGSKCTYADKGESSGKRKGVLSMTGCHAAKCANHVRERASAPKQMSALKAFSKCWLGNPMSENCVHRSHTHGEFSVMSNTK